MPRSAVPLSEFVLKVHSRCDLACDHCYVYESADQSWRGRPRVMSDEVITQAAARIAEHAAAHRLSVVHAVLHGGEPLLAGPGRLGRVAAELRSALTGICDLDLRIHTNGVLLDEKFCELFAGAGIKVGISLDGYKAANDRHRRYADGRSSYHQVIRAIELLRSDRFRDIYAGLLCTIDLANDPIAVYETLISLAPPRIDFLLPHATWDEPPARPAGRRDPYAEWLTAIFDRWQADGCPVQIRTFESIISTSQGGPSLTEALGLGPSSLAVIETDGSYEQADSLKAAYDGAPVTGLDVFSHALDTVVQHPGIAARQQGLDGLSPVCQQCPVVTSCGGGLYAHRYKSGTGFANPSAYCPDLLSLVTHIQSKTTPAPALPVGSMWHIVRDAEFRALAAGPGGEEAVGQLAAGQQSLRRALLARVYQDGVMAVSGDQAAGLHAAWELLTRVDQVNSCALDTVLSHPYIRVWAVRCLEQLGRAPASPDCRPSTGRGPDLATSLGHLGAIAAAAAIRASLGGQVTVPIIDGAAALPTLGRLVTGTGGATGTAAVEVVEGNALVQAGSARWTLSGTELLTGGSSPPAAASGHGPGGWQPLRRLTAPGISVALEDTDPFRDCFRQLAAPRLTDAGFARWHHQFTRAWHEIGRGDHPYADALTGGLCAVTPLAPGPGGRDVSASSRHAFGAVAASLPASPVALAVLLIREFQHIKLGGVLDLIDLCDQSDNRLFRTPGREDARPLEGLLYSTYADLAESDFWQARQHADNSTDAAGARQQLAARRADAASAIAVLERTGSLTPQGMRFVAGMRHSACS
jgi:uncharacterized protein